MSSCLEDSCSICFNAYNGSDHQAVALPCSHSFCVTCLTQLRSSDSNTCPECRKDWKHLQLNVNIKTEMMATGACSDGTPLVAQANAKSEGQDCDCKTEVEREDNHLCPDHALPFWFWCDECKEFSCRKCVAKKQKTCSLCDIEEMLPNIKSYFNSEIETIVSEVQNNADDLNTALTNATDMLSSVTKHIDALRKRQHDLTANVKLLDKMVCKRRQDITTVKKYCDVVNKINKVTEMPVLHKSLKALHDLRQHSAPPMPPSPEGCESDATCTYMAQAGHSAGSSTDAATARAAALLKEGGLWTVDASNWRAAVLALAERQPKHLILRAARDGVPETLTADTVAAIAGAARDCEVWMYCLDTFYIIKDRNTDSQRLERVLANTSLRLTVFYGHLDAAGIARLPRSVRLLGLAIGSAEDAAAVSSMAVWEGLRSLGVAVSTSVAPQHLRPLPCVSWTDVHFYGISEGQVDLIRPAVDALIRPAVDAFIRPAVDALMPDKRSTSLYLPKCQLSAGGARRLAHQLRGAEIDTVCIDPSGLWRPGEEEQRSVSEEFRSAVKCGVEWGGTGLFGGQ